MQEIYNDVAIKPLKTYVQKHPHIGLAMEAHKDKINGEGPIALSILINGFIMIALCSCNRTCKMFVLLVSFSVSNRYITRGL